MNQDDRNNNEYANNDHEVQFFNIDQTNTVQNDVMNLSVDLSSLDNHNANIDESHYTGADNHINECSNVELQQIRNNVSNKDDEYLAIEAVARVQQAGKLPHTMKVPHDASPKNPINNDFAVEFKDPKKFCKFCKKQFSHQGSYGRHLDLKKGDKLHPTEEVAKIRNNVIRRNGSLDTDRIEARKTKKKVASKIYNKRENVKEKNKIRRKLRDREIKAKLLTNEWFLDQLGSISTKHSQQSFAMWVCLYLPVANWPVASLPTTTEFNTLLSMLANNETNMIDEVKGAFTLWQGYSPEKQRELWVNEQKTALEETLGNFTLIELQNRSNIMEREKKSIFDNLCKQDNLVPSTSQNYQKHMNFLDSYESDAEEISQQDQPSSYQHETNNYFENQ